MDSTLVVGIISGGGVAVLGATVEALLTGRSEQRGRLFDLRTAIYSDVTRWTFDYRELLDRSRMQLTSPPIPNPSWQMPWDELRDIQDRKLELAARARLAGTEEMLACWTQATFWAFMWRRSFDPLPPPFKGSDNSQAEDDQLQQRHEGLGSLLMALDELELQMVGELNPVRWRFRPWGLRWTGWRRPQEIPGRTY